MIWCWPGWSSPPRCSTVPALTDLAGDRRVTPRQAHLKRAQKDAYRDDIAKLCFEHASRAGTSRWCSTTSRRCISRLRRKTDRQGRLFQGNAASIRRSWSGCWSTVPGSCWRSVLRRQQSRNHHDPADHPGLPNSATICRHGRSPTPGCSATNLAELRRRAPAVHRRFPDDQSPDRSGVPLPLARAGLLRWTDHRQFLTPRVGRAHSENNELLRAEPVWDPAHPGRAGGGAYCANAPCATTPLWTLQGEQGPRRRRRPEDRPHAQVCHHQQRRHFTFDEASWVWPVCSWGLKGYVTNIIPAAIMGPWGSYRLSYHDLWHVEASFRMSKTDLQRPAHVRPHRRRHRSPPDHRVRCPGCFPGSSNTHRPGTAQRAAPPTTLRSATIAINSAVQDHPTSHQRRANRPSSTHLTRAGVTH